MASTVSPLLVLVNFHCCFIIFTLRFFNTEATTKAYNAADFSEINELADDEERNQRRSFLSRDIHGKYQIVRGGC